MKPRFLLGFAALIGFTVLGQVGSKLAADQLGMISLDVAWLQRVLREPALLLVILGNVGAFFTYLGLLKGAPIGPVFAATHLSIVAVLIVSVAVLHETLSPLQGLGCLLILLGVVLLGVTEKAEPST
jgi:drug/metabolite transporter (DMT)-like permease